MNVVDSSAWVEYFAGGPNAEEFAEVIRDTDNLLVPSLAIYEVFKRLVQLRGEGDAITGVAGMLQGRVVELSASGALEAARVSLKDGLPLADAVIYSVARSEGATLWTQDAHFEGMDGVEFRAGRPAH